MPFICQIARRNDAPRVIRELHELLLIAVLIIGAVSPSGEEVKYGPAGKVVLMIAD